MNGPLYQLRGVRLSYGERVALDLEEFDVLEGEILGLTGHNGSGKSTLLSLLAFLAVPSEGSLRFRGREVLRPTTALRREATLLTQEPYLLKRSVAANVGYGLKVRGVADPQPAVRAALRDVGLDPESFMHRTWRELSGGEAQRVALAARLALEPSVLLLDEPTSNLDPESAERIRAAALGARERGTTLVWVGHDADWLAGVSDRVATLREGRLSKVQTA